MENTTAKRKRKALRPYKPFGSGNTFMFSDILFDPVKISLTLVALSLLILFVFQDYFDSGWNLITWALGYIVGIPVLILIDGIYTARKKEKSKLKHFFIFISIAITIATLFAAMFIFTGFPIEYIL